MQRLKKYREPLVFVAPLAINMDIYDLYPYRSLVKHFQHSGFDVYLVEWKRFRYKHRHLNFLSFIDGAIPQAIERICSHSGSQFISCMAGVWLEFLSRFIPRYIPLNMLKPDRTGQPD